MAPAYVHVSSEAMQYASPTITSGNDHEYSPWKLEGVNRLSGLPPALPGLSHSVENPSWDSVINHACCVPQTDPGLSDLPLSYRPATAERDLSFHRDSVSPQVIATKWHQTVRDSRAPAVQIPPKSVNRAGAGVWIPTGAPLAPNQLALNSLLSPIKLEGQVGKENGEMNAPDLEFYALSRAQSSSGLFNYPTPIRSNSHGSCDGQDERIDPSTPSDKAQRNAKQGSVVTNSLDTASNSQLNSERVYYNFPKRQLSYGQIQRSSKHPTLYRSMGSRQLRNHIEILGEDEQQAVATSPNKVGIGDPRLSSTGCFPLHRKPRIWIDATKYDEKIEKAHLTAITSPPRPHIITIPRRQSSLEPNTVSPSPAAKSISTSDFTPVTPPETPMIASGLQRRPEERSDLENERRASTSLYENSRVPLTPPNSPTQMPQASLFHQPKFIRGGSKSMPRVSSQCELTPWILDELEIAVANFPKAMLRLDSPVIQHLRRISFQRQLPKPISKTAKASHLAAPHSRYSARSRYSIFRPLSSHPWKGQCSEAPDDINTTNSSPSLFLNHRTLDSSPVNPTLAALQAIFPHTSTSTLECLQATYIALHHFFAARPAQSPAVASQPDSMLSLAQIPPKAREMLGMQSPTSFDAAHAFSSIRPSMPEYRHEDAIQARVLSLAKGLNAVVRDLLGGIEGRYLDDCDAAFVRTVGEVVRLGERRSRSLSGCRMED